MTIQISKRNNKSTLALADTGASHNFIEQRFIQGMGLVKQRLPEQSVVKGALNTSGLIQHYVRLKFKHNKDLYEEIFLIIDSPLPQPVVFGIGFFKQHPEILSRLISPPTSSSKPITMVGRRQILADLKNPDNQVHLCWLRKKDQENSETQSHKILQRFDDVVVDEIPQGNSNKPLATPTVQHHIDLVEGAAPVAKRAYRLSASDRDELDKQLSELIASGNVIPSESPYAAPVIFVQKKDGTKRLCVDYRGLNDITIKSKFPLPLIEDVLDQLSGATIFSKLDLISGYHQVAIADEDQYKTAFTTHRGQYSWRVMPFGLTNAPATFQRLMNYVLRDYINKICVVYLDDILIYSKNEKEHSEHVSTIINVLRKHQLYAKKSKCEFYVPKIQFLGHELSAKGITPDKEKILAIKDWPTPKTYKDAQSFIGLAGYYRRFIKDFSYIAKPLHQFAAQKIKWTDECKESLDKLKRQLSTAPIIIPFDRTKQIVLTTDASSTAIGAVLELYGKGTLKSELVGVVAYLSHLLRDNELNWPIRDKELYAVIFAFKKWRHYLAGTHIIIKTDHHSLQYFKTSVLDSNLRLARWRDILEEFDYEIQYIKGSTNHADALSRPPMLNSLVASKVELPEEDLRKLETAYSTDPFFSKIVKHLKDPALEPPIEVRTPLQNHKLEGNLLYYTKEENMPKRLCIPQGTQRQTVLHLHHDAAAASHPGQHRTLQALLENYYWPGMENDIKRYVSTCRACQQNKHPVLLSPGTFHPLPSGTHRWSHINIDFLGGLVPSQGHDCIMVVIDRATKMAHFIPVTKGADSETVIDLFIDSVLKLHGFPVEILSDQDKLFTSKLWQRSMQRFKIATKFTSTYNPSTDGQVERMNRTIMEMLRHYLTDNPSAWVMLLPVVEFAYNNTYQVSIQTTPFFANYGYHPRLPGFYHLITSGGQSEKEARGTELGDLDDRIIQQNNIFLIIQERIAAAQQKQALQYNKKHRHAEFEVGDKVLVHQQAYWPGYHKGLKLHHIWYGPFPVTAADGANLTLDLPRQRTRRNTTFHMKYIKLYDERTNATPTAPPVTPGQIRQRTNEITKIVSLDTQLNKIEAQWQHCEPSDISLVSPQDLQRTPYLERLLDHYDMSEADKIGTNRFRKHR